MRPNSSCWGAFLMASLPKIGCAACTALCMAVVSTAVLIYPTSAGTRVPHVGTTARSRIEPRVDVRSLSTSTRLCEKNNHNKSRDVAFCHIFVEGACTWASTRISTIGALVVVRALYKLHTSKYNTSTRTSAAVALARTSLVSNQYCCLCVHALTEL